MEARGGVLTAIPAEPIVPLQTGERSAAYRRFVLCSVGLADFEYVVDVDVASGPALMPTATHPLPEKT